MSRWIVVYGKYEGLEEKALNLINGAVCELYKDYLSFYSSSEVSIDLIKNNDLIIVGTKNDNRLISELEGGDIIKSAEKPQGYSIAIM